MKKKIITIILSLIVLTLFFGLGYFFGQKKSIPPLAENPLPQILGNKVISSLNGIASGEVIGILGRNLSLKAQNDILTLYISEKALVEKLVLPEGIDLSSIAKEGKLPENMTLERKKIKLEEIKTGDVAVVNFELNIDGTFNVRQVTVTTPITFQ